MDILRKSNETWDVPDDHFTDDVLCHWKCLKECLTEDERDFVRTRGKWKPDISDGAFDVPSGDHGFHGWNPKCIPSIYYINWKVEQAKIWHETCKMPDFEEFQSRKTSSQLRRESGEERRKSGIKEKYGATKCYRDDNHKMKWD